MDTRATNERDVPSLLFPELWTTEYLIDVLEKRYINQPNLHNLEREELLNIYYGLILPKPQRSYRPNRRGQAMTAAQNLSNKRKRISAPDASDGSQTYTFGLSAGGRVRTARTPQYSLKPPPSSSHPDKKIIRLSSGGASSKPDGAVDEGKAESPVTSPTTLTPARTSGVIKLKRASTSSSDTSVTSSTKSGEKTPSSTTAKPAKTQTADSTGETPTKKPKFSKISWP